MSDMIPFDFHGWQIQAVEIEGEPWFGTKGVCDALNIGTSNVSRHVESDQRGSYSVRTLGGPQQVSVVSESGLYMLAFASRKPEAHQFRQWVAREVLPAIHRTGSYGPPAEPEPVPELPGEFVSMERAVDLLLHRYWLKFDVEGLYSTFELCGLLRQTRVPRSEWKYCLATTPSKALMVNQRFLGDIVAAITWTAAQLRQKNGIQLKLPFVERDELASITNDE